MKNTSVLITGTIIAQAIPIILQPVLRRLFTPDDFGTYQVYLSLIGILIIIACWRFDDAIILPAGDKESTDLLFLSMLLSFCINILVFLIILLSGEGLLKLLNLTGKISVKVLYLVPLGTFLLSIVQVFNNWLIRRKKFSSVSVSKITRRGGEASAQMVFALGRNGNGLILSDIIGQIISFFTVFYVSLKQGFSFRLFSRQGSTSAFSSYSDFPRYNLIPAILSSVSFYFPALIINKFYSTGATGFYDLAKMLLSIPLALIATSFSNVLLQSTSAKFLNRESLITDLKPVFAVIMIIILSELVVIGFFGTEIFVFAFGERWRTSGEISGMLMWSFSLNFLISTFSCVYISMRKIKIYSIWQLFYFLLIISLLFFHDLEFRDFLRVYVLFEVFAYLIIGLNMIYIIGKYESSIRKDAV